MSGIVTGEEAYGYAFFNCLHPLRSWNDNDEAYLYVRFNRLRVQCALRDIVTGSEEHLHVVFNAHIRVDGQMACSTGPSVKSEVQGSEGGAKARALGGGTSDAFAVGWLPLARIRKALCLESETSESSSDSRRGHGMMDRGPGGAAYLNEGALDGVVERIFWMYVLLRYFFKQF